MFEIKGLDRPFHAYEVHVKRLAELFAAVALDHDFDDQEPEAIQITSYAFGVWLRMDHQAQVLNYYSFWSLADGVDETAALRFVNGLNQDTGFPTYYWPDGSTMLMGVYDLSVRDGIMPRHLLRTASRFARDFRSAVAEGNRQGVTAPLIDLPASKWDFDPKLVSVN